MRPNWDISRCRRRGAGIATEWVKGGWCSPLVWGVSMSVASTVTLESTDIGCPPALELRPELLGPFQDLLVVGNAHDV